MWFLKVSFACFRIICFKDRHTWWDLSVCYQTPRSRVLLLLQFFPSPFNLSFNIIIVTNEIKELKTSPSSLSTPTHKSLVKWMALQTQTERQDSDLKQQKPEDSPARCIAQLPGYQAEWLPRQQAPYILFTTLNGHVLYGFLQLPLVRLLPPPPIPAHSFISRRWS